MVGRETGGVRPIREAWEQALYGPRGFYTRQGPGAHFRTSPTASPLFARAIAELAAASHLDTVYDMAAGGGELAAGLAAVGPDLTVIGIDLRPRPDGLPDRVGWRSALPDRLTGLVVANEWLDNVPCTVAEVDDDGRLREVLVESDQEHETLGTGPEALGTGTRRSGTAARRSGTTSPGPTSSGRAAGGPRRIRGRESRSGAPATRVGATSSAVSTGESRSRSTTAMSRGRGRRTARCGPIGVGAPSTSRTTGAATSPPTSPSTRSPTPSTVGCYA
jgi:hypothetical protein